MASLAGAGCVSCSGSVGDYLLYAGGALLVAAGLGGAFYVGARWAGRRSYERAYEVGSVRGYMRGVAKGRPEPEEDNIETSLREIFGLDGPHSAAWKLFKKCSSRQSALGVFIAFIEAGEFGQVKRAMNHARQKWRNPRLNADMVIALAVHLQKASSTAHAEPKLSNQLIDIAKEMELDVDHVVTAFRHLLDEKDWTNAVNVFGVASRDLCVVLARELFLCRKAPANLINTAALATEDDVGSFASAIGILRGQRKYTNIERLLEYAGKTMSHRAVKTLMSVLSNQAGRPTVDPEDNLFAALGLEPTLTLEPRVLERAYRKNLAAAAAIVSDGERAERVERIGRAYEVLNDVDTCAQHFAEVGVDAVVAMRGGD